MQGRNNKISSCIISRCVRFFFKRNLLLTNLLTSGGFMCIGDLVQQNLDFKSKSSPRRYDWPRAGRMFVAGCILGSGHHYYYLYLDKLLPRQDVKTVLKKVAADQLFCSPVTILCFFLGMGLLEKRSTEYITEELKQKFTYVYLADCCFWPPIQCVNFYFLPAQYRVLYINIATMVFNVFLSYMKHTTF